MTIVWAVMIIFFTVSSITFLPVDSYSKNRLKAKILAYGFVMICLTWVVMCSAFMTGCLSSHGSVPVIIVSTMLTMTLFLFTYNTVYLTKEGD